MAAEYIEPASALPLLMEPLEPHPKARRATGWTVHEAWEGVGWRRRIVRYRVRNNRYDAHGALAQHVIVRYLVHGVGRAQIAAETGICERQIQAYAQGRALEPYTLAVLGALRQLGISPKRGQRARAKTNRTLEIIDAQTAILERAAGLLAYLPTEGAAEVTTLARLLLAGREPLTPGRGTS